MTRLSVTSLQLDGLKLIERDSFEDLRGSFSRMFCSNELMSVGWSVPIAQINHSYTASKGSVRGMHFQVPPYSEVKLVTCISGEILDIVIDIREGSDTFLNYHAEVLTAKNGRALLIPEGFAHGFQTLSNNVDLIYCHSKHYQSDAEAGINPNDPLINIDWPLPISQISDRDKSRARLSSAFKGFNFV